MRPAAIAIASVALAGLGCGLIEPPIDLDNTVMAIVSARDMYPGVVIEEGDLYAVEIPAALLANGSFLSPEHVVGRIPKERILANEFVRAQRLTDPDPDKGMQSLVPNGMRTIAFPGNGQPLAPRGYVDLWTTGEASCALAQAVFVMSVNGEIMDDTPAAAQQLSLLVSPEQMAPLLRAASTDSLRITVRGNDDTSVDAEVQCSH